MDPLKKTVDSAQDAEARRLCRRGRTQTEWSRFGGVPAAHACAVGCLCGKGSSPRDALLLSAHLLGTACDAVDLSDRAQMVSQWAMLPMMPFNSIVCTSRGVPSATSQRVAAVRSSARRVRHSSSDTSSSSNWCSSPRRRTDSRRRSSGSSRQAVAEVIDVGRDRRSGRCWRRRRLCRQLVERAKQPSSPAFNMYAPSLGAPLTSSLNSVVSVFDISAVFIGNRSARPQGALSTQLCQRTLPSADDALLHVARRNRLARCCFCLIASHSRLASPVCRGSTVLLRTCRST